MIEKIIEMHEKFSIGSKDMPFTPREKEFRIAAMQEELDEYDMADRPEEELDALVDLVVFALGTAERQGWALVFGEALNRVMEANMQKELGGNAKRGNFKRDLVKPPGWKPAELKDLV